jgi:NADPH:quinone reductase
MKAIVVHQFGGPEVLKYESAPQPTAGPGQLLVHVEAAGVNPADTYMRSGNYARKPALPYTPGVDGAGVIEGIGAAQPPGANWKMGDRVYLSGSVTGTYAEYAVVASADAHPLPDEVSFAQGAGLHIPYATAYRALFQKGHGKPNETVLIHGASGGVGIAAVQFAHAAGMRVIGTAGSDRGRELVKREGADYVLDHKAADLGAQVLKLTENRGADLIIEMLANVNLGNDLKMLAPHGRVVIVGSRGGVQITPRDLMQREGAIYAVMLWNVSPEEMSAINAAISAGLGNGSLCPVVGNEIPLAEAARAQTEIMSTTAYGKMVLVP